MVIVVSVGVVHREGPGREQAHTHTHTSSQGVKDCYYFIYMQPKLHTTRDVGRRREKSSRGSE